MKKHITYLTSVLVLFSGAVLFNSCSKTGPTGPAGANGSTGPAGPSYSGTLTGHVFLTNQYGDLADTGIAYSSVRAILYNANTMAVIDSINVKSSGTYSFNVTTGIYTLALRDTNYGQELYEGFQFIGPGNLEAPNKELAHLPNFNIVKVDLDSVNHAQSTVVMVDTIATSTMARNIAIFMGGSPSVSSAPGMYSSVYTYTLAANTNKFVVKIPLANIYGGGLQSGSTVYFAIYGAAYDYTTASEYVDYTTGRTIYNALSATPVTSVPSPIVLP
jgi:hypothetical protein